MLQLLLLLVGKRRVLLPPPRAFARRAPTMDAGRFGGCQALQVVLVKVWYGGDWAGFQVQGEASFALEIGFQEGGLALLLNRL